MRAVVAAPDKRCWLDRDEIPPNRREANVPGACSQPVTRCETIHSNPGPDYWRVAYHFRGQTHHVQIRWLPGDTGDRRPVCRPVLEDGLRQRVPVQRS